MIEQHLYNSLGAHALIALALADLRVTVNVAPWSDLTAVTEAAFEAAELRHVWAATDTSPSEFALPWDIIGFDCTDLGGGRWEFLVNCSVVEFCWRSTWPISTKSKHTESAPARDRA